MSDAPDLDLTQKYETADVYEAKLAGFPWWGRLIWGAHLAHNEVENNAEYAMRRAEAEQMNLQLRMVETARMAQATNALRHSRVPTFLSAGVPMQDDMSFGMPSVAPPGPRILQGSDMPAGFDEGMVRLSHVMQKAAAAMAQRDVEMAKEAAIGFQDVGNVAKKAISGLGGAIKGVFTKAPAAAAPGVKGMVLGAKGSMPLAGAVTKLPKPAMVTNPTMAGSVQAHAAYKGLPTNVRGAIDNSNLVKNLGVPPSVATQLAEQSPKNVAALMAGDPTGGVTSSTRRAGTAVTNVPSVQPASGVRTKAPVAGTAAPPASQKMVLGAKGSMPLTPAPAANAVQTKPVAAAQPPAKAVQPAAQAPAQKPAVQPAQQQAPAPAAPAAPASAGQVVQPPQVPVIQPPPAAANPVVAPPAPTPPPPPPPASVEKPPVQTAQVIPPQPAARVVGAAGNTPLYAGAVRPPGKGPMGAANTLPSQADKPGGWDTFKDNFKRKATWGGALGAGALALGAHEVAGLGKAGLNALGNVNERPDLYGTGMTAPGSVNQYGVPMY